MADFIATCTAAASATDMAIAHNDEMRKARAEWDSPVKVSRIGRILNSFKALWG